MASFKTQQVLRTARELKSSEGAVIPAGTRVVVMSYPTEKSVKVKVAPLTSEPADFLGSRVVAGENHFDLTFRGRPRLPEGDDESDS
jgi:hypothetical protein